MNDIRKEGKIMYNNAVENHETMKTNIDKICLNKSRLLRMNTKDLCCALNSFTKKDIV